jgi:hypothetical protein
MTQEAFNFEAPDLAAVVISTLQQYVPARARRTDPQTSFDAAALWDKHKLTATQMCVLSFFLKHKRGTDGVMEEWVVRTYPRLKFAPSSLRKRRGDLCEMGILRACGKDEERKMTVWEMTNCQIKREAKGDNSRGWLTGIMRKLFGGKENSLAASAR